jgi:hypothetical protein
MTPEPDRHVSERGSRARFQACFESAGFAGLKPLIASMVVLFGSAAYAESPASPCTGRVQSYIIEVSSQPFSSPVSFEAAIGSSGVLRIVNAKTPYRFEISTAKFVAMFIVKTEGAKLTVELFAQDGSTLQSLGSITDAAPLILENATCPELGRAFGRI